MPVIAVSKMPPRKSIIIKYSASTIAILAVLLLYGLASVSNRIKGLSELRSVGKDANATVVATHCDDHGKVFYSFHAGERIVTASSHACGFSCGDIRVGDSLSIKYLDNNPKENECGVIDKKIDNQLVKIYMILAFSAFITLIGFISCMRKLAELKLVQ